MASASALKAGGLFRGEIQFTPGGVKFCDGNRIIGFPIFCGLSWFVNLCLASIIII
jgi:hypothetical protein